MTIVVTDQDRNNIQYFIKEKRDITRWCQWEEKKDAIFGLYPELRAALHSLEMAELTLNHIIAGIANGERG